jgi:hypothetical protein
MQTELKENINNEHYIYKTVMEWMDITKMDLVTVALRFVIMPQANLTSTWGCTILGAAQSSLFYFYLLTELSPSSEATNCAATQEFTNILWNPKVHYGVPNSLPLVPILSQIDPVYTMPSYLSKIYFNIAHQPTSWSF